MSLSNFLYISTQIALEKAVEAKYPDEDKDVQASQASQTALKCNEAHKEATVKVKPTSTMVFYKGKEMSTCEADHLAGKMAGEQKDTGK